MSSLHTSAEGKTTNGDASNEAASRGNNDDNQKKKKTQPTSPWTYIALIVLIIISYTTMPDPLQPQHGEEPSIRHVFYYGWLTAISTGLGAVPLAFAPNLASYWVGISNGEFVKEKNCVVVCVCVQNVGMC